MPRTADRTPGVGDQEGIVFESDVTVPVTNGEMRYVTGVGFRFFDEGVEVGLGGGSGISETAHKTLLQLIHFIDEGPAEGFTSLATKTVTGGFFPTLIEWKRSDATLLVRKTITRSGAGTLVKPTPIVWEMFDTDGTTVLATVSDAVVYSGVAESSRTRTIS